MIAKGNCSAIAAGNTGTYIGYGFAIPINLAKSVAKDLIANGKVNRGYIGVNIGEVDNAIAKSLGIDKPRGIIVQGIVPGGAAENSDVKAGDVILKIDERDVNQPNELQSYVASKSAGSTVTLTIFRDGKELDKKVILKSRDNDTKIEPVTDKSKNDPKNESNSSTINFEELGLVTKNLSTKEKTEYNLDEGVLIADVKPFSKAEDQKLFKGLVIVEADKQTINSVDDLQNVIENKKGKAILLKVLDSKGNARYVGLEIPK